MKRAVIVLMLCLICPEGFGTRQADKPPLDARLRKDKPTVYMEFVRQGHREPLANRESEKGIWLRLHNNIKSSIVLNMHGVPSPEYGDASLIYDVLSEGETLIGGSCHVCSVNSLRSGGSLLFSIPAEYLSKGRAVRVKFSYDWEEPNNVTAGQEPEHYVYFYASQLPKSEAQQQVKEH
jgi:hypothetical protein